MSDKERKKRGPGRVWPEGKKYTDNIKVPVEPNIKQAFKSKTREEGTGMAREIRKFIRTYLGLSADE